MCDLITVIQCLFIHVSTFYKYFLEVTIKQLKERIKNYEDKMEVTAQVRKHLEQPFIHYVVDFFLLIDGRHTIIYLHL